MGIRILLALCLALAARASAIPWPLGDGSTGWESIFPITRTFGNFDENLFWILVDSTYCLGTFHGGIDLSLEDASTENIRAVEAGVFEDCWPTYPGGNEWFAQIFPSGSSYGWHYGHVQGDDGVPRPLNQVTPGTHSASYGDLLGTMAEIGANKHLHFFRTDQYIFENGDPGIDNPLDYLNPAPTFENDYTWEITNSDPPVFFLPQHDAIYGSDSWGAIYNPPSPGSPVDPSAVLSDILDQNGLFGSVDIMYGCFAKGYPQGGTVVCSGIPQRVRWDLSEILHNGVEEQFTKLLVDFDGVVGAAPGDWEQFRRLYFPFFAFMLGWYGDGYNARILCLTNCGDASGWSGLGISNIEENCWNTALSLDGDGENYNPLIQQTSDGLYRIDVTAFAWDTNVSQTVSIDCQVCNTREIVQEVELLHENLTRYEACWVAEETPEGYVPYLHIYSNDPIDVEGGTTVTVHIVFSGPMDTSVTPTVTFSRPGFHDLPPLTRPAHPGLIFPRS